MELQFLVSNSNSTTESLSLCHSLIEILSQSYKVTIEPGGPKIRNYNDVNIYSWNGKTLN